MDGNGRWAKSRHLPRAAGHKAGVDAARSIVELCGKKGIKVLTLFAFSSENWRRPREEVNFLMDLFHRSLQQEIKKLHKNQVRVRFIGDISKFTPKLQKSIVQAANLTEDNQGTTLIIAANYGGHWDICRAAQNLAEMVEQGLIVPEDITPDLFEIHVSLNGLPAPDLLIRTSGEYRISNFLLWQLAYTELHFTQTLWPDFNEAELDKALAFYEGRQRRFGQTSEQMERTQHA